MRLSYAFITVTLVTCLNVLSALESAADFSNTDISRRQVPHYVIIDDFRHQVETLQTAGGYISLREVVCVSAEYYQQWLSADGRRNVSYPERRQCWENTRSFNRKATGRCKELSSYLASIPNRSFPLPVCEFYDPTTQKPIWTALRNVRTVHIPEK